MRIVSLVLGVGGILLSISACSTQIDPASGERVGRTSQAIGGGPDGTPCVSGADCTSGYCYPGPDQYYCMAESSNCAQPLTSGVFYGDSYVYNANTYYCVSGQGLVYAAPGADGSTCTSGAGCTSGYCYPGPDQNYCLNAAYNCAQPGTSGILIDGSYVYHGVTYDCVSGVGLQGAPFPNGSACNSAAECTSGYCYPGPDRSYCITGSANCAWPGTGGATFGESYSFHGVTYDCTAGQGLTTPSAPYADGQACSLSSQCSSGYCYGGPDQNYCIAATANCAWPGMGGAQFGESFSYQGVTYDCTAGQGLTTPSKPYASGTACGTDSDCSSGYCYAGPDQNYCIDASANCAWPGKAGAQFGDTYSYQGVTYGCVSGQGLTAMTAPYADGVACSANSQCTNSNCYPGPDQDYCIAATSNCAEPGTSGVTFGQGYVYKGTEYTCTSGVGLQTCVPQTCTQLGLNCAGTDNCGAPINCGTCTSPQTCGGGGPGICG